MKVISFVFVLYVLASANAIRSGSYSSTITSVISMPDIEDSSSKRTTRLTQLKSKQTPSNTTTSSNTTSSNTSTTTNSNTTAPPPANSNSTNTTNASRSVNGSSYRSLSANVGIYSNNSSDAYFNIICGLSVMLVALLI